MMLYSNSEQYYRNTSSLAEMRNVLVLTMPKSKNYTILMNDDSNKTVRSCNPFVNICMLLHGSLFFVFLSLIGHILWLEVVPLLLILPAFFYC